MENMHLALELLFILLRNMGVVVTFAYLLSRTILFKRFFYNPLNLNEKLFLIFFFGLLSISGTYLGIHIMDAYANIRAIGAIVAGFLGGPVIGIAAGAIGGIQRYTLGGFTALACAIGTINSGFIGGLFHQSFKKRKINGFKAFYIGIGALIIEMIIVLIFSRPFSFALELVSVIGIPMILSNAIGISIFVNILEVVQKETENIRAQQAKIVLEIANLTLPHFIKGLSNLNEIKKAAKIILNKTGVSAVAITDNKNILAFVGAGEDHHQVGQPYITEATRKAIASGKVAVVKNKKEIGCVNYNCPLETAVVAPLKWNEQVIGTLKLYNTEEKLSKVDILLATGLSSLLSTQMQLAQLSEQARLKTQAELRALQAQVNPHFLFNSLNTIASFMRTNPVKARELLLKLSDFFRSTLHKGHSLVTIEQEIENTLNYFSIEKARFAEKLELEINIPEEIMHIKIPSFTIQPLVENSIKHGILPKNRKGIVKVDAREREDKLLIIIQDDGIGIPDTELHRILQEGYGKGSGIGLSNVNGRIKSIFGPEYGVKVESNINQGTRVNIILPLKKSIEGREKSAGISS